MIIDIRSLRDQTMLQTDICIIGAGPAGMAIASEFAGRSTDICVIESGGLSEDSKIEALSEGENSGEYPVNVASRKRYFGGATNIWGGNSAPYDPIDFENRPYVPKAQWPFPFSELQKYFPRAYEFCGLKTAQDEPGAWDENSPDYQDRSIFINGDKVRTKIFKRRRLRFGKRFRSLFQSGSPNLKLYTHSTALRLEVSRNARHVERALIGSIDGKRYNIAAKVFVLAAGIENPRILLLSNDIQTEGLGNKYDNVGRYFMRHFNILSGILITRPPYRNLSLYRLSTYREPVGVHSVHPFAGFQISEAVQREEQILNFVAFLTPLFHLSPSESGEAHIFRHALRLRKSAGMQTNGPWSLTQKAGLRILEWLRYLQGPRFYAIRNFVEQAPSRENRISLSRERDAFGLRRLQVQWAIGEQEKRTMEIAQQHLGRAFLEAGLGRLETDLPPYQSAWPHYLAHASHFMGTTRMSDNPQDGVVDENSRMHSVDNLYIAGGSVLPVGGACMVTYNLIALALRLADHLKQRVQ